MPSDLVPSSSAAHGITLSQNVARDVEERIGELRAATKTSAVAAFLCVALPAAVIAGLCATGNWFAAIMTGYCSVVVLPAGPVIHVYRKKALKYAEALNRDRDVCWVSKKDGLIFFGDEGLFIEKRGGFKVYGFNDRRFNDVLVVDGTLTLHGRDSITGGTYSLDVTVPDGWTDADTARVRGKLDAFVPKRG